MMLLRAKGVHDRCWIPGCDLQQRHCVAFGFSSPMLPILEGLNTDSYHSSELSLGFVQFLPDRLDIEGTELKAAAWR
jgi:hypothetical protein